MPMYVGVGLVGKGLEGVPPLSRCTTYGANETDSAGTTIDPGGSTDTKGSWTEVVSSTTNDIRWLIMALSHAANPTAAQARWLFDIAVGAGGSEKAIMENVQVTATWDESLIGSSISFPISIPAGSRLAVRSQSNIGNATDRLLDVVLYGID